MAESIDFVFDNHILPMNRSIVEQYMKSQLRRRFFSFLRGNGGRDNLDARVDEEVERLNKNFEFTRSFFEEMRNQNYCNSHYKVYRNHMGSECHEVVIRGGGSEIFDINGLPSFRMSEDGNRRFAFLPVRKDADEFNIIIHEHPQVDIPAFGQLEVMYLFQTTFSLGTSYSPFTENPMESWKSNIDSGYTGYNPPTRLWYGKPGHVYYRTGDALFEELVNSIFGAFAVMRVKRSKFHMDGKIYLKGSGTFLYQGIIDSDGFFPFFIKKDYGKETKSTTPIIPKLVVSV